MTSQNGSLRHLLLLAAASICAVFASVATFWYFSAANIIAISVALILMPTFFGVIWDIFLTLAVVVLPRNALYEISFRHSEQPAGLTFDVPLVIPVLIRGTKDVTAALRSAEENAELAADPRVTIVLLVDFADSAACCDVRDEKLRLELENGIRALNDAQGPDRSAVEILCRQRSWNQFDQRWMGWERKRGKLVEFMRLCRGHETTFAAADVSRWQAAPFLLTIDVDTRIQGKAVGDLVAAYRLCCELQSDAEFPAILAPTLETLEQPLEPLSRFLTEPDFLRPVDDWREPKVGQLVFGRDLFNGKGLIHIDRFLGGAQAVPENCVLSHDHLEAMLSGACSISTVSVFEPFPRSRRDWELRHHRWSRGDFQTLPWVLFGRSPFAPKTTTRLPLQRRVTLARIAGAGGNSILKYAAVSMLALADVRLGIVCAVLIAATGREGLLSALLAISRTCCKGYRKTRLFETGVYLLVNATLRSIGELIFFQRNVIVHAHAVAVTAWRMMSGRRGLMEWYPADPQRIGQYRRQVEVGVLAIGFGLLATTSVGAGLMFIAWVLTPAAVSRVPLLANRKARAVLPRQGAAVTCSAIEPRPAVAGVKAHLSSVSKSASSIS